MANVFTRSNDVTMHPNRNTFDLSFVNNMTLKAGQITPCFLKSVIPGDSIQIDATFGFNFQPMVFPVQTDMQANLHFFYVRNRSLWKGWQDFITRQENLEGDSVPPYIRLTKDNRKMFETGQIGDYLGIPTVYYGAKDEVKSAQVRGYWNSSSRGYIMNPSLASVTAEGTTDAIFYRLANEFASKDSVALTDTIAGDLLGAINVGYSGSFDGFDSIRNKTKGAGSAGSVPVIRVMSMPLPPNTRRFTSFSPATLFTALGINESQTTIAKTGRVYQVVQLVIDMTLFRDYFDETKEVDFSLSDVIPAIRVNALSDVSSVTSPLAVLNKNCVNAPVFTINLPETDTNHEYCYIAFGMSYLIDSDPYGVPIGVFNSTIRFDASFGIQNSERDLFDLPFATDDMVSSEDNSHRLRVTALPFRAVESCYNAFYRDDRNNPLMIDGKPYYNTWVQNRKGGPDSGLYKMYKRNWESDVFTTAVQSPTQGVLPLVGVTATGNMTFQDENGKTYYLQAEMEDDGTITGISSYSSDMPSGTLRAMVDTISTGISINDFRNVNAFQRWLEIGMRKGLRYKDNIEAHFGVSPTYSELDMPEFIGGMSRKVQMNRIVQSVDQPEQGRPLGTLGGYATVLGDGGQKVSKYVDEHGWIIGFITITPKPVYSQQLSKELLKTELLDYYFPEFAHISMQPILNREIAPLQCVNAATGVNGNGLEDVFGYQRAWYEYLSSVDEVHGDFRTTMRDYLIQRTFDGVPQLSEEFLTVGDKEVNEVFAVEDAAVDKIFGQLYFDVKMKRPIPEKGVPQLEV